MDTEQGSARPRLDPLSWPNHHWLVDGALMPNTKTRAGIALVIAALTAGCGSDSSTAPKSTNPLDLATIFSQMSFGDPNAIPGASGLITPGFTTSVGVQSIVPSACSYSASAGGFTCPTRTVGGITFTISYFLYDAAGQAQSAPDAATTAAVRTVIDAAGTLTLQSSTAVSTIADHQDMTLSGLLTSTRILNGTGTMHLDLSFTGTTTDHEVTDAKTTTSNVTFKAPSTSGPNWPTSGTITTDVTATSSLSTTPLTTQMVMTFNGSGLVTMVMTFNGTVLETCTLDLTGKTAPSCAQGA